MTPADKKPANPAQGVTELADLRTEIERKLPADFPNYADWTVTLPAGHWRALTAAIGAGGQAVSDADVSAKYDEWCKFIEANGLEPLPGMAFVAGVKAFSAALTKGGEDA